jgi:hypothetical protein
MSNRRWIAALMAALTAGTLSLAHAAAHEPAFLNGGVGQEDASRMHAAAKDYSMQIEFSEKRDNQLLADARVRIVDAHGRTVFRNAHAGPILLVRVPPGTYRVIARADGRTETQTTTVRPQHTSDLHFHWRGTPVAMAGKGSH